MLSLSAPFLPQKKICTLPCKSSISTTQLRRSLRRERYCTVIWVTLSTSALTPRPLQKGRPKPPLGSMGLGRWRWLEFDRAGDAEAPRLGARQHLGIALEKVLRVGKVFDQRATSA